MLDNYADAELTVVSLTSAPPKPPERRQHVRHVTVLRVAKLCTRHGEEFCLVRNISSGGLMAHVYSPLATGDALTVEFRSGAAIEGSVIWRRDELAGIQFEGPVDCAHLLCSDEFLPADFRPRAPRVTLRAQARLRMGARYRSVTVHNVSQGGANITPADPAELDEPVVLSIPGLFPISGCVRWVNGERAGIAFDVPVSLEALAQWVADFQCRTRGPVPLMPRPGSASEGGTLLIAHA